MIKTIGIWILDWVLKKVIELVARWHRTETQKHEAIRKSEQIKKQYDEAKDENGRRKAFEDAFNLACSNGKCDYDSN
jgi:hypothetical protein